MLSEWYFCCCIRANPADTEAFLSILDVLENPESDSQLLYLAYNELERTEDRMQIYALPVVLKSLRRENLPAGLKSRIKRYLENLIESVPEKVEDSVRQLIELALSNQTENLTKIIKVVNIFVKENQDLQERRLSPTPYLELQEFLPETLVLAIIADRLENNEKLVDEFAGKINNQDETSWINVFLEAALDYQFGRLAFRLAASIASLTSTTDTEELRVLIAQKASLAPHAEPDLLHTYALILFRDTSQKNQTSTQCYRIIQESLNLFELRTLIQEIPIKKSYAVDTSFRIVGVQRTPNRTQGLPVFYWQIILWELAAQIHALTTADELRKFWHPQTKLPEFLNINCSEADILQKAKAQFKSVIELLKLPAKIDLAINKRKNFYLNDKYIWLFLSPWIARGSDRELYPSVDEPTLQIRTMASVFVAIRLLQQLAQDRNNWERVEFAARFVAHGFDIITTIENSNSNRNKEGDTPLLSDPLMGLFQFARRQIQLVGTGKLNSIDPQMFVEICDKAQLSQEKHSSWEESLFLNLVLPEVMVSWILDAYPSAVSPQGSGRWLERIISVYNYHTAYNKRHKFRGRQRAALVVRFLSPKYSLTLDEKLDWRTEYSKKDVWEVRPRKLLLTERQLDPSIWIQLETDEKVQWKSEISSKLFVSNKLVYTLELLDAIANHLPNFEIKEEDLEKYFKNLKSYLNNAEESKDIDRFTRLRLVEFLDSSILDNRAEEQVVVASVLLEYGTVYDLKKMLEKVYGTEEDDTTLKKATTAAREELQEALLPIIYKRLEKEAELLQEVHYESDDLSQSRKAQSPRETYKSLQNAKFLKEWVTKLLYLSSIDENKDYFSDLGENLASLREKSLERKVTKGIRAKTLNVELRDKQKLLVSNEKPTDWVIKAINYNPNKLRAKVFYEEFDTKEIKNLFKTIPHEVRNLSQKDNEPLNVQALVIDKVEEPGDRASWKYTFDCGFEFPLTHSSDRDLSLKPGDFVKLPIRQFQEGNELKWKVSDQDLRLIKDLTHKTLPGDIEKIGVGEIWRDDRRTSWYLERQLNQQTKVEVERSIWDADISRYFCQHSHSLKPDVFAKLNEQHKWVPLDLDFSDLLAKLCHSKQHSSVAVLTLIEPETIEKFGEKAWRFSRHRGENYLIEQHHFLGDNSKKLAEEIDRFQDCINGAVGLLIAVKPDFEAKQVGLKLVTYSINLDQLEKFYPNLSLPFDDRNIKWRELFAPSDERLKAKKDDNGNWFCDLNEYENKVIPGYPRQVKVKWDGRLRPTSNQKTADLIVSEWQEFQWQNAVVKGEVPEYYEITPEKKDWVRFLDRWLNLPRRQYIESGERVVLRKYSKRSIEREQDGFVSCFTTENMLVLVQIESITMLPQEDRTKVFIGEKREAEILWIDWQEISTPPEIYDPENAVPPEEVRQNNQCLGIITRIPQSSTEGTQCQVMWQVSPGEIKEQDLEIDNLSDIKLNKGYKIVGYKNQGKWQFYIEKPKIRVRALWSLKKLKSSNSDKLYYLGKLSHNGEDLEVAEQEYHPGELVYLSDISEEISHLAVGKKDQSGVLKFEGKSFWENSNTSNTAGYRNTLDEALYERAILKFGDRLLIGDCRKAMGNEKVTVQDIELVTESRPDEKFVLRRRFYLRKSRYINIKEYKTNTDTKLWKERLEKYLQEPRTLAATLVENQDELGFLLSKGGPDEIRVPEDFSEKNWTLWVPLASEEGKFVMTGNYSDQAKIYLFRVKNWQVWASCHRVPPITLEEFRRDYCEAARPGTNVLLKNKNLNLYYVGPETVDDSTDRNDREIHHRFEMGYGETLLIPESQLEFNDGPFSQAQLSLFHGDRIKVISFKQAPNEESANYEEVEDEESVDRQQVQHILNIKSTDIEWSEARQLYNQRSLYKIVHLLHLKPESNSLEINYIDGFNENTTAQLRKFERFKASLSDESQERLSDRWQRWLNDGESDPVIFGRLDEERFRNSYGREIYFNHVRLSFQGSSNSCLDNREMVFLRGDKIIELGKNDMALTLKPPKGLDQEDVGEDGKELLLLRRNFSIRENLLKQVYEEKGEMEFSDDRLLLQLTRKDSQTITSNLLILDDRVPARKASALRGAISNSGRTGLLAVIVFAEDEGTVQIEYKPGIFIRLRAYQIESPLKNLPRGTLVRITNAPNGKFIITRAAFGNAQYVSKSIRPAVVLPTNDIQRTKPEEWKHKGRFVIGGLPDIVARFGEYTDNQWKSKNTLQLETITNLIATQHPKIISLGKDGRENYRIAPPSDEFPCGHLLKIDNSHKVQYVPLHSEATEQNNPIPWHLLSFGDESVKQIVKRADSQSWRYHDDQTFTWNKDTQKFEPENLRNRPHTVWSGPIFFELIDEELRLRYTKYKFRKFGFPVEELINALKDENRSHLYPIAGVNKWEHSLWIELAPGRLVELPTQLIVWRSEANNKERSLTDLMHWEGFAPGDLVELEIVSTDPLTIDRIALKEWIPGIRNALGSSKCFLPVNTVNTESGEISLGRGEFQLKLPFADENPNWKMVILTAENNQIEGVAVTSSMENPQPNDVVFLELNTQEQLVVVGFETIEPRIKEKDIDVVKNIIRAAGGALPVTVEEFNTENKHLLFSMRHQEKAAHIAPNRISLASFVDILPDAKTAILRCGGGLISLPMQKIVPGVDRSLYNDAAKELKQARVSLWLRQEKNVNGITVGFRDDSKNQDLLVKSLDILLQKDGEVGLICQSIETKILHWLPIQEAAWTELSVEEFRDVFKSKEIKVRRKLITRDHQLGKNYKAYIISVLAATDVYAEAKKLTIGQELLVQVIQQVVSNDENKRRYLVESLKTEVILDCEIYDDYRELQLGETLSVEVSLHIQGDQDLITVVPVDNKRKYLDLPTWMTEKFPLPGKQRQSIRKYLRWRQNNQLSLVGNDKKENYSQIDKSLCSWFNDAFGTHGKEGANSHLEGQLKAAQDWDNQNRYKHEINAAFAIMAILLLNKHEKTKFEAYTLTQNLGQRALRSLHIEVIYQGWLRIPNNLERKDGLWQRLQQLKVQKYSNVSLEENNPDAIRRFCNAVEMRSERKLLPIANSLSAALGELSNPLEMNRDTIVPVTKELIALDRTLHPLSRIKELQNYHTNKLQEILKLIEENGYDIMLLEPLNYKTDNYSEDSGGIDSQSEFPQYQGKINWGDWILEKIDNLDDLTEQYASLEENIINLKNGFKRINEIKIMED
ncbi:MAG: hypothetical protein F6K54_09645 [Okeania sp. SIO3B5]|uniref:hypothetical protein n=1 Tax=Okeania sp. SIO3B5 TaxID=2607811 RepID=UPI0013FF5C8D|nr:hypothetical protein [Okeania sp. SIO3B5]NEO53319.1 hypothetical protein [Okeania sp. SIO3B5]